MSKNHEIDYYSEKLNLYWLIIVNDITEWFREEKVQADFTHRQRHKSPN